MIQEIDIATGRMVFEWRAQKHIDLDESYAPLPQGTSAHLPYDYLHPTSVGLAADGPRRVLGDPGACLAGPRTSALLGL